MAELATNQHDELAPAEGRVWHLHHRRKITLWGIAFVLPAIIFFAIFKYGPMLWAIESSADNRQAVVIASDRRFENVQVLVTKAIRGAFLFQHCRFFYFRARGSCSDRVGIVGSVVTSV